MDCATCQKPLRSDNTHGYCRAHRDSYKSQYNKKYRELHRDKLIDYSKNYYTSNKESLKEQSRISSKIYYENNKDKKLIWQRNKRSSDITYKIKVNLRSRLYQAIRNQYKSGSAIADLGCTVEAFKSHIETLFKPGMTWDNWGIHTWHLDHKKSLHSFDLNDPVEFRKACHYTNLQPLWAKDNISKSNK